MSKKKPKLYKLQSALVLAATDAEDALWYLEELINEHGGGKYRNTFYKHVKLVEIKSDDDLPSEVTLKEKPTNGKYFYDCTDDSEVEDDFWDCISHASTINDYLEYANKK